MKLLIIGGFLGAGKTTLIAKMARHLIDSGLRVGVVTNDQGTELVDTNYLRQEIGLTVVEVTGGCFCCNFDEFTQKLNELSGALPDVILAEPVGSCTDLVATIFKPLSKILDFSLCPLCIVADPKRVARLSINSPFPDEINYLFNKQMEEANIILLNKTDQLDENKIASQKSLLEQKFPGALVLPISAKSGNGVAEVLSRALSLQPQLNPLKEIDYDTYAMAEACLGWFNGMAIVSGKNVDFNKFLEDLMSGISRGIAAENCEIAHLKAYAVSQHDFCKASITSVDETAEFNKKMTIEADRATVIINARVNMEPEALEKMVRDNFSQVSGTFGVESSDLKVESFKPSYPKPRYRME